MELSFAPMSMQMLNPKLLQKPTASCVVSSSSFKDTHVGCSRPSVCRLVRHSVLFSSRKLEGRRNLKLACSASFSDFSDEDLSRRIEELVEGLSNATNELDENVKDSTACAISETSSDLRYKAGEGRTEVDFSMQLLPSKIELLEPSLLGIRPEPPDWPERDQISRINIEQKANCVGIPISLRMIKRKQKGQRGFVDAAGESASARCSLKNAISSLVFIVRELHNHALQIRGSLYCEDLQGVMSKVQGEMNSSFVWLFQHVFSRTPALMVYVMILLANFTVSSAADNAANAATLASRLHFETISNAVAITEQETEEQGKSCSSSSIHFSDEILIDSSFGMTDEEVRLWNSVTEEASRMQRGPAYKALMRQLVSPLFVEIEPDDYEEYFRTDLVYQMGIAEEPNNPLLLLNYAQFLHLVARDHDRAEECFKRAIQAEPPDAEALSQYADFLWRIRKDLWEAEERYQQAMAAEPENSYNASKYANFLWSTGGEETCFPPSSSSHGNYDDVS